MATHHEHRQMTYLSRDVRSLASTLESEAKRLRDFAEAMDNAAVDNGAPLDVASKHNIRSNTRRAMFSSMHTSGFNSSVETILHSLDRFVEGDDN